MWHSGFGSGRARQRAQGASSTISSSLHVDQQKKRKKKIQNWQISAILSDQPVTVLSFSIRCLESIFFPREAQQFLSVVHWDLPLVTCIADDADLSRGVGSADPPVAADGRVRRHAALQPRRVDRDQDRKYRPRSPGYKTHKAHPSIWQTNCLHHLVQILKSCRAP